MNLGAMSGIEVMLVNLLTGYLCLQRKYSMPCFLSIAVAITLISQFLCSEMIQYDRENHFSTLLTLFFLFPIFFLYKEVMHKKLLVFFTVWIHVFAVDNIANYLPKLFIQHGDIQDSIRFLLQTILFIITVPMVIKFIKIEFVFLVNNLSRKYFRFLIFNTIMWFALLNLARIVLLHEPAEPLSIYLFVFLTIAIALVYPLVFSLAKDTIMVVHLEKTANTDSLTHVGSRNKFYADGEEMVKNIELFALIYMDLDQFKIINDSMGHQAGDRYLRIFAKTAEMLVLPHGQLYRLSGDEFIILCPDKSVDHLANKISQHHWQEFSKDFAGGFRGVSLGVASYLQDGNLLEKIVHAADIEMYAAKKNQLQNPNLNPCLPVFLQQNLHDSKSLTS